MHSLTSWCALLHKSELMLEPYFCIFSIITVNINIAYIVKWHQVIRQGVVGLIILALWRDKSKWYKQTCRFAIFFYLLTAFSANANRKELSSALQFICRSHKCVPQLMRNIHNNVLVLFLIIFHNNNDKFINGLLNKPYIISAIIH